MGAKLLQQAPRRIKGGLLVWGCVLEWSITRALMIPTGIQERAESCMHVGLCWCDNSESIGNNQSNAMDNKHKMWRVVMEIQSLEA